MATKRLSESNVPDKYADFVYEISQTEYEEALWLIEQGDFKDLEDFIESSRRAQISIWMDAEAEREREAKLRAKKREESKKRNKAA